MRKFIRLAVSCFILFWGAASGCSSSIPDKIGDLPVLVIPSGSEPPALTADFSFPSWSRAAVMSLDHPTFAQAPPLSTFVRTFCTSDNLYVGFSCDETQGQLIIDDETRIWDRDSVEIYIEPRENLVGRPYNHIVIDAAGNVSCKRYHVYPRYFQLTAFDEPWRPNVRAATAQTARGWNCVVKIPLADLHLNDAARQGGLWRLNFCRSRPGRQASESNAHWSWSPLWQGSFQEPTRFGYAVLAMWARDDSSRRVAQIQAALPIDASRTMAADPKIQSQVDQLLNSLLDGGDQAGHELQELAYRGDAMYALVSARIANLAASGDRREEWTLREFTYELKRDRPDDDPPPESIQRKIDLWRPLQISNADGHVMKYRLRDPDGLSATRSYPLVIFLHGSAERGSDNWRQLFAGIWHYADPDFQAKYPCFVMLPQCPLDYGWADLTSNPQSRAVLRESSNYRLAAQPGLGTRLLLTAIDQVVADHPQIDRDRIYLVGSSMGGFGTYELLMRRPAFFAGAVILCGGGDDTQAALIASVPIWDFHGALDQNVHVEASRKMVEALRKAGGMPRYTEYPRRGHALGEPNFEPATLDWMFAQNRKREIKPQKTPNN